MSNLDIEMGYELKWHIPDKVLLLALHGDYTIENAREVNRLINGELDQSHSPLTVLVDATHMNRPYNFGDIRTVQTYMNHQQLKNIFVASDDRLVKLAMLVIFNLSRAQFQVFDNMDKAMNRVSQTLDRRVN